MGSTAFSAAPATGGLDGRLVATTRLVLSSSVLFIIGPADFDQSPSVFHILSALYTSYSALLYMFTGRQVPRLLSKMSYWADVSWAALLIAFSDESSVALLFLFPTLIASLHWSFVAALRLTLVAANILVAIGFLKAYMGADLRLHEILLPPIYLLVFGYLVAWWGDREIATKRRLVLLKEITRLSNPRFGMDRTIGIMMERLRAFHDAEACLMLVTDLASNEHRLRSVDRRDAERASEAESIPPETAQLLLAPPLERATIYLGVPRAWEWWRSPKASYYVFDVRKGRRITPAPAMDEALITMLDAESFISVPLHYPDNTIGRLYLTAARRRAFSPADLSFLLQVLEQIVPVIENIRLVDQLASNAAEEERRGLARDIHDNVIQSYIGLQIGLAAVSQKLHAGNGDITNDIAQLKAITDQELGALRHYVHWLPGTGKRENVLLAAVRRFITTFTEATHIAVQVEAASDLYINDRLVAEVFQMVVEGLSNIRRHTHATSASIGLAREKDSLILRIVNDGADAAAPARFIPWSIAERAAALGGQAHVEHTVGGSTQVTVEIPL
jgi:signal transduction histidine kinase